MLAAGEQATHMLVELMRQKTGRPLKEGGAHPYQAQSSEGSDETARVSVVVERKERCVSPASWSCVNPSVL